MHRALRRPVSKTEEVAFASGLACTNLLMIAGVRCRSASILPESTSFDGFQHRMKPRQQNTQRWSVGLSLQTHTLCWQQQQPEACGVLIVCLRRQETLPLSHWTHGWPVIGRLHSCVHAAYPSNSIIPFRYEREKPTTAGRQQFIHTRSSHESCPNEHLWTGDGTRPVQLGNNGAQLIKPHVSPDTFYTLNTAHSALVFEGLEGGSGKRYFQLSCTL